MSVHKDGRGLRSRYVAGCRCDLCRRANTEYQRRADEARRARMPSTPLPHGTASTYSNWGCRCQPCTEANTIRCRPAQRVYNARQKAKRAAAA